MRTFMYMIFALLLALTPFAAQAQRDESRPLAIGLAVESKLDARNTQTDGIAHERWRLAGRAGQIFTIELASEQFDTLLRIYAPDGRLLVTDDNSGVGLNARILIKLPVDGNYII